MTTRSAPFVARRSACRAAPGGRMSRRMPRGRRTLCPWTTWNHETGQDLVEAPGRAYVPSELDLEVVLRRARVRPRLRPARATRRSATDESRAELERSNAIGIVDDALERIGDLPKGRGVLGERPRPVPLRLAEVAPSGTATAFRAGDPPTRTFLGVPVLIGGFPYGDRDPTEKAAARSRPRRTSSDHSLGRSRRGDRRRSA